MHQKQLPRASVPAAARIFQCNEQQSLAACWLPGWSAQLPLKLGHCETAAAHLEARHLRVRSSGQQRRRSGLVPQPRRNVQRRHACGRWHSRADGLQSRCSALQARLPPSRLSFRFHPPWFLNLAHLGTLRTAWRKAGGSDRPKTAAARVRRLHPGVQSVRWVLPPLPRAAPPAWAVGRAGRRAWGRAAGMDSTMQWKLGRAARMQRRAQQCNGNWAGRRDGKAGSTMQWNQPCEGRSNSDQCNTSEQAVGGRPRRRTCDCRSGLQRAAPQSCWGPRCELPALCPGSAQAATVPSACCPPGARQSGHTRFVPAAPVLG